jgi:hypothetical protein
LPSYNVYDILADLRTHLEWGGARQSSDFRLLSLEASPGPAKVGTAFSSTGTIPMSGRRWEDRSTVTVADRPTTFEFTTEARAGERNAMTARYRHRYEISSEGAGSRVTYTLTQLAIAHPMLRMALLGIRQMTWRVAIPMFAGRGFRNLLGLAAEHAAAIESTPPSSNVAGHSMHTKEI